MLAPGPKAADNTSMTSARRLCCLFSLLLLSSCLSWTTVRPDFVWDRRPAGVSLATTPPGAMVVVDGVDSGFATPCMLDFDTDESHRVELELDGYSTAGLYLMPNRRWFLIPYNDANRAPRVWRFPLWLPMGEFFLPVRTNTALAPSRIHLRLRLGSNDLEAPPSAASMGEPGS